MAIKLTIEVNGCHNGVANHVTTGDVVGWLMQIVDVVAGSLVARQTSEAEVAGTNPASTAMILM